MHTKTILRNVIGFTFIAFIATYALIFLGKLNASVLLLAVAQITPGLVFVVIWLVTGNKGQKLKEIGITQFGRFRWYPYAIIIALIPILIGYIACVMLGMATWNKPLNYNAWMLVLHKNTIGLITFLITGPLFWVFIEELAWRGYLQTQLKKITSTKQAYFLVALIWVVWHFIFMFDSRYTLSSKFLLDAAMFVLAMLPMSMVLSYIRDNSQSLWPCILLRAAINSFIWILFYQFTFHSTNYIYLTGQSSIVSLIFWLGFALILFMRKRCDVGGTLASQE